MKRRSEGRVGTPTSGIHYVGPPHGRKGEKTPCPVCGGRVVKVTVGKGTTQRTDHSCQRCGERWPA